MPSDRRSAGTEEYKQRRAKLLQLVPDNPSTTPAARRASLVDLTDEWLKELYDEAGGRKAGMVLIAVGGYGRRELAPGSDLDLVFVHDDAADVSVHADLLWYPIWDSGLRLDHSVRTPAEVRNAARDDLKVLLGLLDARVIAGDQELGAMVRSRVLDDWRSTARKRLPELRAEIDERAKRSGELAHLLEPDLKDSYGGLRDVSVLRAIAASWVTDQPHGDVSTAHQLLLDVRDALHTSTGRASDVLLLQEQQSVAALLDKDQDSLARGVSAAGRSIAYASDVTWHAVTRSAASRTLRRIRRGGSRAVRSPLAQGVVLQEGEAVLAADVDAAQDPTLVLRAAAAAAQAGVRLSPYSMERLALECAELPTPWPREARELLGSLLGAGRPALPVWEALDQAGLTTRLIPEWEVVRSAPQRNPIHQFTVDRHMVETAINAALLTRRVSRPDLLLIGALLHDIGKARPGDHTEVGMDLVAVIAPRMGFDPSDSATLVAMVEHHLLLPQVATGRDLDDPTTVAQVLEAVGDHKTLDLLHALTEADALATGPAAWSEWKKQLVDELVARTHAALRGDGVPDRQVLTGAQRALLHGSGVEVLIESTSALTRVTVAADDRVGLLATVAGVLALNRLSVRAATTESAEDRAVTVWMVQPDFGDLPAPDKLGDDVRRALAGRLDVVAALARRTSSYERPQAGVRPPARVDVIADASKRATVLEVRAHDQPGLLHTVAAAISATGVTIVGARVATLGSEVVDVFYLQDGAGLPVVAESADHVRAAVLAALATG